jgi:hypothetical protein
MKIASTTTTLILLFATAPVFAQVNANYCGPIAGNHYGPYDYRSDHFVAAPGDQESYSHKRILVDGAHFTPRVENLIGAQSGGRSAPPGADIDYTLRAFPNHHRALMSVMRYGEKTKSDKPAGLSMVVECYFERAARFKPNDTIVKMLYATYLIKSKRAPEAAQQLELATSLAKDNGFTHYNIGLVYFDMKNYGKALIQAHQAMGLGFERTELRDLLKGANQWQEPKEGMPAQSDGQSAVQPPVAPLVAPKLPQ